MEFFSDFNYDDLEEINMSGGGNTEVPEPGRLIQETYKCLKK